MDPVVTPAVANGQANQSPEDKAKTQNEASAGLNSEPVEPKAKGSTANPVIQRLIHQRDTVRAESQITSHRLNALDQKFELLLSKLGGNFSDNTETLTQIKGINSERDKVVGDISKDLSDKELIQQAEDASDQAIDQVEDILSSTKIDFANFNDPDVTEISKCHDRIFLSGSLNYSELIVLASKIATKRLRDSQPDIDKAKEDGKREVIETMKKAGSVKVDIPGAQTQGIAKNDAHARRLSALSKAYGDAWSSE